MEYHIKIPIYSIHTKDIIGYHLYSLPSFINIDQPNPNFEFLNSFLVGKYYNLRKMHEKDIEQLLIDDYEYLQKIAEKQLSLTWHQDKTKEEIISLILQAIKK